MNQRTIYQYILFFFLVCFPSTLLWAQEENYNKKGDEAFNRKDYREAKMWYEEGVSNCDDYSISKLTNIWVKSKSMRPSMRSLMSKCLTCLNLRAIERDTVAMKQLMLYYSKGIGADSSNEMVVYWREKVENERKRALLPPLVASSEKLKEERKWKYLIGYHYSSLMPYGLTLGMMRKSIGFYARFQTNLNFQETTTEVTNEGKIKDIKDYTYYRFDQEKKSNYAATVGVIKQLKPWLYASIGVGYGVHQLAWHHKNYAYETHKNVGEAWSYNTDASFKGVAGNVDVMLKYKVFFISVGANTVNFKYVDLNAGAGFIF